MNELTKVNNDIVYAGFKFGKNGLQAVGEPSFDNWQECGEFIKKAEGAVQFWLGDWIKYGEGHYGEMYTQALEDTGYEYKTLVNDKYVASKIESSRRRDNLSFSHHAEVADLPPADQDKMLDIAEKDNLKRGEFRKVVREYKHKLLPQPVLPDGEFNVIYADPPWKYDFSETGSREIENKYPTMEVEEICAMSVPSSDHAVLFMWATAPKLREALKVMESWGFEYKTHAVWDKEIIGMGYWFRGQHELLLVGVKNSYPSPDESTRESSVYKERRTQHSKKPTNYYDLIERYCPNGKYLELFARVKHSDKWTVYGNQL